MPNKPTEYSLQKLENWSADQTVEPHILRRGLVAITAGGTYRSVLAKYVLNNWSVSGAITYMCKEAGKDDWLVIKVDETSGAEFRYATVNNNPTITTYAAALAGKSTLTYGTYGDAF